MAAKITCFFVGCHSLPIKSWGLGWGMIMLEIWCSMISMDFAGQSPCFCAVFLYNIKPDIGFQSCNYFMVHGSYLIALKRSEKITTHQGYLTSSIHAEPSVRCLLFTLVSVTKISGTELRITELLPHNTSKLGLITIGVVLMNLCLLLLTVWTSSRYTCILLHPK